MTHNILINGKKLNFLTEVVIEKDIEKLGDTAVIKIPGMRAAKALEKEKSIKRGMPIVISIGYNSDPFKELTGFVSSVATDNNITVKCEDGMFDFHTDSKNQIIKDIAAPDLIAELVSSAGLNYEVIPGTNAGDIKFDRFEIRNVSVYEALAKIKNQTGYNIYVRGNQLHVQLRHFSDAIDNVINYDYSKNIEKSDLTYILEEERKLQVDVVGMDRANKKVHVTVGVPGGDKITQLAYNISDKKALEAFGKEILKRYSYTGYYGNITGWLFPYISYGWQANIINPDYPEREGKYLVERVKSTFSKAGGVRRVGLGVKL